MIDVVVSVDHDDHEIALLEKWLPSLSAQERAYFKGATEALFYAQEDYDVLRLCLPPRKEIL